MESRYIISILLLAYAISPVFADCAGYTDSFNVRVLDNALRPIEGAAVTVRFDRGTSFGEQYFTTTPRYTDAQGMVHFDILNQGTKTRPIDCKIDITASVGGSTKKMTIQANIHGTPVDILITNVYPLRFYVRNQLGGPLENASVTVANITNKTDSKGMVRYFLKTGSYSYLANYLDAQQSGSLTISNDSTFEVVFSYYAITIRVIDDTGEPLGSTLTIMNQTFELPDGTFQNDKVFGEELPYTVAYAGLIREGTLMPATEPELTVTYDTHAPLFGEITPGDVGGRPQLTIAITDPNRHASGVDPSSVKVQYKVEPADEMSPWSNAVTFTSGRNKFTAQFPEMPANSIVRFKIEVKDQEGNRADIEGKFSTLVVSQGQNGTQNQTNPPEPQPEPQGTPFLYIFVGIIILILVVYVVFRLKAQLTKGS